MLKFYLPASIIAVIVTPVATATKSLIWRRWVCASVNFGRKPTHQREPESHSLLTHPVAQFDQEEGTADE